MYVCVFVSLSVCLRVLHLPLLMIIYQGFVFRLFMLFLSPSYFVSCHVFFCQTELLVIKGGLLNNFSFLSFSVCLCIYAERRLDHAQAGVCSHVCLWGELVSIRDCPTGGQNYHETGKVIRSRKKRFKIFIFYFIIK